MNEPAVSHPITLGDAPVVADPHRHYAWLRANAPVYRGRMTATGDTDVWLVSRYADCRRLLLDERFPRSPRGRSALTDGFPEHVRLVMGDSLVYKDDPEHRRLRRLVIKPFTPRAVRRLGERVETLAHALLDRLEPRGEADLREEYARPIPLAVIGDMVGVPDDERERFADGVQALIGGLDRLHDPEWNDEIKTLVGMVRELIERRRGSPGEDILTGLVQAEEDGDKLSGDELVAMVFTLITAGFETTYNLITNAVLTLLDHPAEQARLRSTPSLTSSAVEEVIRYAGPAQSTEPLTAAEDVTWHGETIPAGAMVLPLLAAADLDPEAFAAPEVFDIARDPNPHIGFGHGAHHCLGAHLARLETRIALDVLLRRNPGLSLAVPREELVPDAVPLFTRYPRLPVRLGG